MRTVSRLGPEQVFFLLLSAAVLLLYLPFLGNPLFFDDAALVQGALRDRYGQGLRLQERMLSYGSFFWVEALAGEGWWKQRLVNVLLHLGVTVLLYRFSAALMGHLRRGAESPGSRGTGTSIDRPEPSLDPSSMAALQLGVVLFALNPVAVYAVGYLIQRSILMATLFTLVSLLAFLRWAEGRGWLWLVGAVTGYLLAVLSKEHAVAAAALWLPILVFVRRPEARLLLRTGIAAVILVGVVAADLFIRYRNVIGQVFDATSQGYVAQLELLRPGIGDIVYPLSILNQAALFLPYMGLWLVPNVGWMSIDLRPPFPLGFASLPHVLGALGFLALMGWAVVALLRGSDRRGMTGLLLLLAGILFLTEFATVWIQDPFVLYRSYLWAIGLPGLVAALVVGRPPKTMLTVAGITGFLLAGLSFERLSTFRSDSALWSDATDKTALFPQPSAVGRGRAYFHRGAQLLNGGPPELALNDFIKAIELGDPLGTSPYNLGVALQLLGRHSDALVAFDRAEQMGFDDVGLHYHRGESALEIGQFPLAVRSLGRALEYPQDSEWRAWTRLRRAEAAVEAGDFAAALEGVTELLSTPQDRDRALLGAARAYVGVGRSPLAMQALDELLAFRPSAAAHELRADLKGQSGDRAGALADLEEALRMDPSSSTIREKRDRLAGPR